MASAHTQHDLRREMSRVAHSARQASTAKIAYSVRCPHFRIRKTTECSVSSPIRGNSHLSNGPNIFDECSNDIASPDAEKMRTIQAATRPQ